MDNLTIDDDRLRTLAVLRHVEAALTAPPDLPETASERLSRLAFELSELARMTESARTRFLKHAAKHPELVGGRGANL